MTPARSAARATWTADLLTFLAVECPPLLPAARERLRLDGPAAIEAHMIGALERLCALPDGEAAAPVHPGLDAEGAAARYREYVEEILRGFFRRLAIRDAITPEQKRRLYRWMVLTRALDDRLKELFDRKDVLWGTFPSPMKGFRSWSQEAIVGAALPLRPGKDVVGPMIRDLGVILALTDDVDGPLLAQAGKSGTPFDGRDLHVGDLDKGILPPAAPLGLSAQTLIGIAYAFKLDRSDRVCVSFIGEGGSSLGEWHEAVNFAGAQRLNMVFVLENNQWALGTHVSEQSAAKRFALRGPGYGIPGVTVFGNDPEEVAAATAWAVERARAGKGPALLELVTYRRGGHAHHDDPRFHGMPHRKGYESDEERERWAAADPIETYGARLRAEGVLADPVAVRAWAQGRVDEATERMRQAPWPEPEAGGVFAVRAEPAAPERPRPTRAAGYDEAIRLAMVELMESDPHVFVIGEDVGGRYEGAFGVTRGLAKRFGPERCLNAPLAEGAIVGCAVGAALMGKRPIVEIQFADFLAPAFNALVNNAAKIHWRCRKRVPMVVRLPYGGATKGMQALLGGGPFHSQCPEAWFLRTPGWKIVAPATPTDAKGLLAAAVRDGNPVIYLEAKGLYSFFSRDLKEEVPLGADFEVPIGKALVRREGRHVTCVAYGAMVFAALDAAGMLASEGIDLEVVDLRSLVPLDEETILASVRKTNRLLIVHEDWKRGGVGAEIAAIVAERAVWDLDAPVVRVAAPDHPVPYSPPLEYAFLPKAEDVARAARELMRS
ncbi:MAG: dehydrogenase [Planctomycetes bacterium]|nr:dehydrogenase [Planctomycetota bacterium]